MITIKDIAKKANVSITTVSNALNDKPNISEETKKKVLMICEEMNYHPNIMARNLKRQKTNTVMFMFSDFERSFYLKIINGINDCLIKNKMGLIISSYFSTKSLLYNGMVDGAILLDKQVESEEVLRAASDHLKIVSMESILQSPYASSVLSDNHSSMMEIVEGLIHKRIKRFYFVGGVEHTLDHKERLEAFRSALKKHKIPFEKTQYFVGDFTMTSGYRVGRLIAVSNTLPEAVVCANDEMAYGVIKAFQEMNIDVPGQVSVSGFDGDQMIGFQEGYLTTAIIPYYEKGYLAAETLIKMLNLDISSTVHKVKAPVHWGQSTR